MSKDLLKEVMKYGKFTPLLLLGFAAPEFFYSVQPGEMAIKFNYLTGLSKIAVNEGFHMKLPFIEKPIIFQSRTKKISMSISTQNRDLQESFINADVFYKPDVSKLDIIYRTLGPDYDKKVMDNILKEVVRGTVAQYNAQQLLTQRDQISSQIKNSIAQRARTHNILIDGFTVSGIRFSDNYQKAVDDKQAAQQDAERAKYVVNQRTQEKRSIVIQSDAEAKGIELIGKQTKENPAFLDLQRINFAVELSEIFANSRNKVLLNTDMLLIDIFSSDSK